MDKFETCLRAVLEEEGGFNDDLRDRGRATNQGVSLKAASVHWVGGKLPFDFDGDGEVTAGDIAQVHLHPDVRDAFYRVNYWNPVWGDKLVLPIAYSLFDWAVISGAGTVIRHLQHRLPTKEDGVMGPATVEKMRTVGIEEVCCRLFQARVVHAEEIVIGDPTQARFLAGWRMRAVRVLWRAGGMNPVP